MNNSCIKLKWAKSEMKGTYNFGDDLSPYIISKLSGRKICYILFAGSRINIIKQFIKGLMFSNYSLRHLKNFLKSFIASEYIISIGSIIQWYGSKRCIVWGSGIISRQDQIKQSKFMAVRGKYTMARIKNLGYPEPLAIGDPALLLPLIYNNQIKKKYKLGIIPHINHNYYFSQMIIGDDILIIDLNRGNVEKIIDEINSCEYTISTSLHGLIVSHSYNIKSLWYTIPEKPLGGDDVKFLDYFSSVEIPEYIPFTFSINERLNSSEIIKTIHNHNSINCNQIDISIVQIQLLKVAPFPIIEKYKIY